MKIEELLEPLLRNNQPTVEELKSLYESEMYQNLLNEYAKRSNRALDNSEQSASELLDELTFCQKCYAILDASFEEILSEFQKSKDLFLDFLIAYSKKSKDKEIELPFVPKIYKTFLLERFCDFYLLKTAIQKSHKYNPTGSRNGNHLEK